MYLTHYYLRIMPFEVSPDPRFIWLSEKHKEALDSLKYGIQGNKGFILLTGDIGTGKTTLINCFLSKNETDAIIASISDPADLSLVDFFLLISKKFNLNTGFNTKGEFLIQFEKFLQNIDSEQKKAILIIDEAQRLNQHLLEQIRLLSNIEKRYEKLINIFLVGQNELYQLIMDEKNRALRQRIAVHYNIEPLKESETRDYVYHRLRIAGSKQEIFNSKAIHEIFTFSKGYPRLINTICDRALLTGYVSDIRKIDGKIVKECADELIMTAKKDDTRNADLRKPEVDKEQERNCASYLPPSVLLRNQVISRLKSTATLREDLVINIVCELGDQRRIRVVKDLADMIKTAGICVKLVTNQPFFPQSPPPIRAVYNPNDEYLFIKVISALEGYVGGKAKWTRKFGMQSGMIILGFCGIPQFYANTGVEFH